MVQQIVELLDLPDEILLIILENLHSVEIMYSLAGVNKRLDAMAISISNSKIIYLSKCLYDDVSSIYDAILDRICSDILSRICDNIEVVSLDASIMERFLLAYKYPNLFNLLITDFCPQTALQYLTDESSISNLLKEQITTLYLYTRKDTTIELFTEACIRLLTVCKKLETLKFKNSNNIQLSLSNFSTSTCLSSTLCHLKITLSNFDDCLYLLDGRLNQLSTFIVEIHEINTSSLDIDNTKILSNLTTFSLICTSYTNVYDTRILPLLRRMSNLKNLTLNLRTNGRLGFIDGIHLENEIFPHISQLEKFNFHIATRVTTFDSEHRKSLDDVQHTFNNWKFGQVKCCIDYFPYGSGKCDIYSVPFNFSHIYGVSNSFRDHSFKYVTRLLVSDQRPFEHDFFYWIDNAFPKLSTLIVSNLEPQQLNDKPNDQFHYPNLVCLDVHFAHTDYINQFLRNEYTHISQPFALSIGYEKLLTVTNNFTNDATRINCSQINFLIIHKPIVYPESFYLYFPLL